MAWDTSGKVWMDAIVSDEIDFRNVGNNGDGEVVCVSSDCDMRDFDDDLYDVVKMEYGDTILNMYLSDNDEDEDEDEFM